MKHVYPLFYSLSFISRAQSTHCFSLFVHTKEKRVIGQRHTFTRGNLLFRENANPCCKWVNPGRYMWIDHPRHPHFVPRNKHGDENEGLPARAYLSGTVSCTIRPFFFPLSYRLCRTTTIFRKKSRFFEFEADQKQVLQSFVWCLIFVTWWTLATRNLQGSYSTYITEWDYNFLFFFSFSLCLKMLFTRLTVGWAAFQRAVYCGVSLNNHTTQVKCLQSFKHFILRASLGNRQAKEKKERKKEKNGKKNKTKNANELFHTSACHSKLPTKRQSAFKMF